MSEPIPASEWVWCGFPGHFIAAQSCRMHLHTRVGDYRISTVGAYFPAEIRGGAVYTGDDRKQDDVGWCRRSETMVFKVEGDGEHGEGVVVDWGGVLCEGYPDDDAKDAERGHIALCERIAAGWVPTWEAS